jgi:hypothetical protein
MRLATKGRADLLPASCILAFAPMPELPESLGFDFGYLPKH